MARIRSLKPEAFQSDTLAEVSLASERTFFGLTTQVDDRGRTADKPAVLNGTLWALRAEREPHTTSDLEAELCQLAAVDLICRYVGCDGRPYLHLVTWDSHQKVDKPSKSRAPRCPLHGQDDYCGRHEGACPEPSRESREPSRAFQSPENGHEDSATAITDADESRQGGIDVLLDGRSAPQVPDQRKPSSREEVRDTLASPREPSMVDLGSRTLDLGPRTLNAAALTAPSSGVPTAAADKPPSHTLAESEGQRVNRLARTFTDRVPLSNFPAVAGVVRKAVRANNANGLPLYTDGQITDGLDALVQEKRSVTADALRIAIEGPPRTSTNSGHQTYRDPDQSEYYDPKAGPR